MFGLYPDPPVQPGRLGSPAARDSGHNCSVTQLKALYPDSAAASVLKTARAIVRFPDAAEMSGTGEKKNKKKLN